MKEFLRRLWYYCWGLKPRPLNGEQMTGVELIAAERKRQVEVKGWTAEHDDLYHANGELLDVALVYLDGYSARQAVDCIRDLTRVGALVAAEIDRLQRLEEK